MATLEEILEVDIKKLNDAIVGLETVQRSAKSEALKISLGAQITAKQNSLTAKQETLTALIKAQQGKFHRTFPLSFSMSSVARSISTSPLHSLKPDDCSR